jgi:hypothetical protein
MSAQIKQQEGFRRWTVWGLEAVRTPWSLVCATLNLRILHRRWRAGDGGRATAAAALLALGSKLITAVGRFLAGLADMPSPIYSQPLRDWLAVR